MTSSSPVPQQFMRYATPRAGSNRRNGRVKRHEGVRSILDTPFATLAGRKPLSPGHLCLPRGQTEPLSSLRRSY